MDQKGRFFLPPLFRRAVEDGDPNFQPGAKPELVIVYGDDSFDFLHAFTMEAMEEMEARIDRLPNSPLKRKMEFIYTGKAEQTSIDADGRILLPPHMREKLGIEGEVYVIASGRTFKIWRKDTHEAKFAADDAAADGLPDGVDLADAMDAELAKLDAG